MWGLKNQQARRATAIKSIQRVLQASSAIYTLKSLYLDLLTIVLKLFSTFGLPVFPTFGLPDFRTLCLPHFKKRETPTIQSHT